MNAFLKLVSFVSSFGPRVVLFVVGCAIFVLVVGVVARWLVFENASKAHEKAPSDTAPPQPLVSGG
jgi:hypothetical protein